MREAPNLITFKTKTQWNGASVMWLHESHLQSEHVMIAKQ